MPRRCSASRKELGRIVRALDALLRSHPGDDDLRRRGGETWLCDP